MLTDKCCRLILLLKYMLTLYTDRKFENNINVLISCPESQKYRSNKQTEFLPQTQIFYVYIFVTQCCKTLNISILQTMTSVRSNDLI